MCRDCAQIEADSHDLVGDMQLLQGDFRASAKSYEASLALWLQLVSVPRAAVIAYKVPHLSLLRVLPTSESCC